MLNNIIYFKNNNIYYYKYKLNNGMLSWFLVPLIIHLYYSYNYIKYIPYISYISIIIAIIGNYESLLFIKKYNYYLAGILSIIIHSILLYPLINIKKYLKPNLVTLLILFFSILIINYLPYWPYIITRDNMIKYIIYLHIIIYFIYFIYKMH